MDNFIFLNGKFIQAYPNSEYALFLPLLLVEAAGNLCRAFLQGSSLQDSRSRTRARTRRSSFARSPLRACSVEPFRWPHACALRSGCWIVGDDGGRGAALSFLPVFKYTPIRRSSADLVFVLRLTQRDNGEWSEPRRRGTAGATGRRCPRGWSPGFHFSTSGRWTAPQAEQRSACRGNGHRTRAGNEQVSTILSETLRNISICCAFRSMLCATRFECVKCNLVFSTFKNNYIVNITVIFRIDYYVVFFNRFYLIALHTRCFTPQWYALPKTY